MVRQRLTNKLASEKAPTQVMPVSSGRGSASSTNLSLLVAGTQDSRQVSSLLSYIYNIGSRNGEKWEIANLNCVSHVSIKLALGNEESSLCLRP